MVEAPNVPLKEALAMTADEPRDDIPEADRAEQEIALGFDEEPDDNEIMAATDPLQADEADRLDQQLEAPEDEDDYDPR